MRSELSRPQIQAVTSRFKYEAKTFFARLASVRAQQKRNLTREDAECEHDDRTR